MRMSALISLLIAATLLAPLAYAGTFNCDGSGITVETETSEQVASICAATNHARAKLRFCGLPEVRGSLTIEVVETLPKGCVASYQCGEDRIKLLPQEVMAAQRSAAGAFGFLDPDAYFRSVVVHEFAHSLFDESPCPFETCVTANEYLAYVAQVRSLTPAQQAAFTKRAAIDHAVEPDEMNAMILALAPEKFAQRAWVHFTQQEDPCAFLGRVLDGTALVDRQFP